MRTQRWLVTIVLLCIGCSDPEFGGEKRALRFQFVLSGCTSVNASQTSLARGGSTVLRIGDPQARPAFEVRSDAPDVVAPQAATLELGCDQDCKSTTGRVTLDALKVGTARLIVSADGVEVDTLSVRVKEATALRLVDDRGASSVSVNRATEVTLVTKMTAGLDEVIAGTPFTWSREGTALPEPSSMSNGDRLTLKPAESGTSTVRAQFNDLSATIDVTVQ